MNGLCSICGTDHQNCSSLIILDHPFSPKAGGRMTAEQIRDIVETVDPDPNRPGGVTVRELSRVGYSSSQFVVLREIAAQLADQNSLLQGHLQIHALTMKHVERIASALEGIERR
jgi:hypothetical protein